ncbi:hypothetical protein CSPX01_13799 [Colletotrichum filicis]|nr:hypothetical protein CSPX01_13799 [Colletotrichum filicis]
MSPFSNFFLFSRSHLSQANVKPCSKASHRRSTGFWSISSSSSSSSGSSGSSERSYNEVTKIAGRHIDKRKLQELLQDRFGDEYRLQLKNNNYRLHADGQLSEAEILSCC